MTNDRLHLIDLISQATNSQRMTTRVRNLLFENGIWDIHDFDRARLCDMLRFEGVGRMTNLILRRIFAMRISERMIEEGIHVPDIQKVFDPAGY